VENLEYSEKILEVLENASIPMDVEHIRVSAGIKNWQTALKHLLELVLESKICGQKTTRGWIFWREKKGFSNTPRPLREETGTE
jgi:hypothetical protein